jgi:hypothetical protein
MIGYLAIFWLGGAIAAYLALLIAAVGDSDRMNNADLIAALAWPLFMPMTIIRALRGRR